MTMSPTGGAAALGGGAPAWPRLAAGAIVAGIGFVVLSVAFAGHVVSGMALPSSQAADARVLAAVSPIVALAGAGHLLAAAALAAGRDLFRIVAAAVTGIVATGGAANAVMTVAWVNPFGAIAPHRLTPGGIGILVIAAALYGVVRDPGRPRPDRGLRVASQGRARRRRVERASAKIVAEVSPCRSFPAMRPT